MSKAPAQARTRSRSGIVRHAPAAVLLVAYWLLTVSAVRDKSTTFDELFHVTAGTSYWRCNDYRLQPENGNWTQRWVSLPVAFGDFHWPTREQLATRHESTWKASEVWLVGDTFFYTVGNDADALLWRARAMVAVLGMALGGLVYAWSTRLFGLGGGRISLALYCFCPTMLAHGGLATSDMAASLCFVLALGTLWRLLHEVSPGNVVASCLSTAALFLAKYSAPLLLPMAAILLVVRLASGQALRVKWRRRAWTIESRWQQAAILLSLALLQAVVTWALVWASFGCRYSAFAHDTSDGDHFNADGVMNVEQEGGLFRLIAAAKQFRLLPEAYLYGFAHTLYFSRERWAFLNGEVRIDGWTGFFPYCLAVKTPLSLFLVLGLAAAAVARAWSMSREVGNRWPAMLGQGFYRTLPLWALFVVYWGFALVTRLNIGHRHILPTYPVMFIWAGAAVRWLDPRHASSTKLRHRVSAGTNLLAHVARPLARGMLALALGWQLVESLGIRPDYLAYFNQLAGGPRHGYRHLVDSSLDWGQDLPGLRRWLGEHGFDAPGVTPPYLAYFGTGSPDYYGIRATHLPCFFERPGHEHVDLQLRGGCYCVSATMLQGVPYHPHLTWTDAEEQQYLGAVELVEQYARARGNPAAVLQLPQAGDQNYISNLLLSFHRLRFSRLCLGLRAREPDAMVGYSILIYHLSDEEINALLPRQPGIDLRGR